jgi:4-amino-4-deoxy-L-arabinose transferase-like glycosyltransferase
MVVTLFFSEYKTLIFEYTIIARNLINGKGFSWSDFGFQSLQPTSLFPPLYIYFCAFFTFISPHSFLPQYVAQALIAASGIVPAYLIGAKMYSGRTGWIFAVLYTVYPELVYVHSRPVPEFAYVVIALWMIYLYVVLLEKSAGSDSAMKISLLLGLITGVGLMTKEGTGVVFGAIVLAIALKKKPFFLSLKSHILPAVLVAVVCLVPWTVRNWIVQGRFIPLRTGAGMNLWVGNHPGGTGTPRTLDGKYSRYELPPDYAARFFSALPDDEQERDDYYKAEAMRFIREDPARYLNLCAKRLGYFLWFDPTHPLAKNTVYRLSYLLLLVFTIFGTVLALRANRLDIILPIILLGYLALYVPVMMLPRYRIIPIVLMLLVSAYALEFLWIRMKGNRIGWGFLRSAG